MKSVMKSVTLVAAAGIAVAAAVSASANDESLPHEAEALAPVLATSQNVEDEIPSDSLIVGQANIRPESSRLLHETLTHQYWVAQDSTGICLVIGAGVNSQVVSDATFGASCMSLADFFHSGLSLRLDQPAIPGTVAHLAPTTTSLVGINNEISERSYESLVHVDEKLSFVSMPAKTADELGDVTVTTRSGDIIFHPMTPIEN